MVEFIKRSRQTATNQPIGVVRITNDDGGKFRADMAMARAVQGVADFSIKKVKDQYEKEDLEAAASQPIFSRNEDGQLEPNTFDKAPGFLGIGERERSTKAQNLYNKRFAISTENAMNTEALNIANNTKNAEEFRQQFEAYVSEQSALMGENFDPILQAQYQLAAADVANKYITGKLKASHVKAEQMAVTDLAANVNDAYRDVQTLIENGQSEEADLLLKVIEKNINDEFENNNQFTASFRNDLLQQGIRAAALGTILNIKQTPNVNPLTITTMLDKALRDGSYVTEQFGQQLIEAGLSPEQAVSIRTVFQGASPATTNNIAQVMSAIKDEEKLFASQLALESAFQNPSDENLRNISTTDANNYFTGQAIDTFLQGQELIGDLPPVLQNMVNYTKATGKMPTAFEDRIDQLLTNAEMDSTTAKNILRVAFLATHNEVGQRVVDGINDTNLGIMFAANKVFGGDIEKARNHLQEVATGALQVRNEKYGKVLQALNIPIKDNYDNQIGNLSKEGRAEVNKHLVKLASEVTGVSEDDFKNVRMINALEQAGLAVYGTYDNPDLILKEFIRSNFVETKYLVNHRFSEVAPERYFFSEQDEKKFVSFVNRLIVENEGLSVSVTDIPVGQMPLAMAEELSARTGQPIAGQNLLGNGYFLEYDNSSTMSEPRYFIRDPKNNYLTTSTEFGEQNLVIDFKKVNANNAIKTRLAVNKAIQEAARRDALELSDPEKTARGIAASGFGVM